jgi:ribosomal protein L11 methyltransferase
VEKTVGTDIDPNAIRATLENCQINDVTAEEYTALQGNLLEDEEFRKSLGSHCYDIVVANILADVIIPLSAVAGEFLKEDGLFITSGIINTKEEEVKEAMIANGFEILSIQRMNDWVSITGKPKK